jgi:hypothetical protein
MEGKTNYSIRGIYSELILYLFTIVFDVISSLYYFFLLIFKSIKSSLKYKHIAAFLTTLLSYPLVIILFFYSGFFLIYGPICVDDYVSPSGRKSITLTVVCYEDCYYQVYRNIFLLDKFIRQEELRSRTAIQSCSQFFKATKIKWSDDENQIQVEINSEENPQIDTIKLSRLFNNSRIATQVKYINPNYYPLFGIFSHYSFLFMSLPKTDE